MSDERPAKPLKINPKVRFRRVFDEGVVIHQERAEALVLNDTAMAFLELCDGQRTLAEIVAGMAEQFEVERDVLEADIAGFVEELERAGLIEPMKA